MLVLLLSSLLFTGCQVTEPSWDNLVPDPAAPAPTQASTAAPAAATTDPAFSGRRSAFCIENPLDCDAQGQPLPEQPEPSPAPVVEPEPEPTPVVVVAPVPTAEPAPAPDLPPPVGMASQPAWGLRLLQTIPHAQPPRAALGLADGSEIVVAPGSMLVDAGVIVIAVGANMVQLAHVQPEGDHAEIETVTLTAQYGSPTPPTP